MKETLRIGESLFQTPHHSELIQFMGNTQDVLRFRESWEMRKKWQERREMRRVPNGISVVVHSVATQCLTIRPMK